MLKLFLIFFKGPVFSECFIWTYIFINFLIIKTLWFLQLLSHSMKIADFPTSDPKVPFSPRFLWSFFVFLPLGISQDVWFWFSLGSGAEVVAYLSEVVSLGTVLMEGADPTKITIQ